MAACELPVALNEGEIEEVLGVVKLLNGHAMQTLGRFRAAEYVLSGGTATVYLEDIDNDGNVGVASIG